ncbi:aminotransferase class V-fold PLP-dependent enzyme [Myroides ceti]|uniref:Aminotransferase class V-fold PLP-dependent enzyme n=1 Tax=Paenimyroides ceti TaxID=395087 RepID=A0ABT8CS44_9FLAO|nr:aminotransferase class V-fold PLP-dependent enzyme [Paenimyroides ceti]MDN3706596.1 aminotransferase class V-fold PLP-dependent enzyme [Paenimyroides ceti]
MDIRKQFPVLDQYTYLNTAGSGLLTKAAQQWRNSHDIWFLEQGSNFRLHQAAFLQDVRVQLAKFFHTGAENTFLIPNFSFGFTTLLQGLPKKTSFLLIEDDYPSLTFPVLNGGFAYEYVTFDEHIEEKIIDKIKTSQPAVFAFSIVQYISGLQINLEFIKRLKQEFPQLILIADGTQFCGTQDFNFDTSGLDVLVGSNYKWMLGGYGNGYILIKEEIKDQLFNNTATVSLPDVPFLKERSLLSLSFEPGHLDTLNFGTLLQSLYFFEQHGFEKIEQQIKKISTTAKKELGNRGLLSDMRMMQQDNSTIFNIPAQEKLIQKLHDANILFSPRGGGIRFSFHFYNSQADLEKLLEIIDSK